MLILADIAAVLVVLGAAQAIAGAVLAARFAAWAGPGTGDPAPPAMRFAGLDDPPPISVLKPLHGDEPLLEAALASVCAQDYGAFQVVFGVQDPADTALPVVARLRARFPRCDIAVVVDPAQHGANAKVSNLINMLPAARYGVLAIADSDLHVQPDYLSRLAAALAEPGTGLVTTLYTGLPADNRLVQQLGATQITHGFLPGALLARAMGRQDCLGATMALRRDTLAQIGGLQALLPHLADDQVLGRLVADLGLAVRLAPTVPATTVPETTLGALLRHELRWARTIRALEPAAFAASILQYPLFWALLAVPLSGGSPWSFGVFFLAWVVRAVAAIAVDRAVEPFLVPPAKPGGGPALPPRFDGSDRRGGGAGAAMPRPDDLRLEDGGKLTDAAAQGLAFPCPVWLLPLRDLISVGVMVASYASRQVEWRGQRQIADTPERPSRDSPRGTVSGATASKGSRPR